MAKVEADPRVSLAINKGQPHKRLSEKSQICHPDTELNEVEGSLSPGKMVVDSSVEFILERSEGPQNDIFGQPHKVAPSSMVLPTSESTMDSAGANKKIRILILEDNASDVELMIRALSKSSIDFTAQHTTGKKSFTKALDIFMPDIILADYKVPGFSGLEAINLARESFSDIPVIIVSGVIGEDYAIEILKAGATDYVLKDKLSKLELAINRAIDEVYELKEKKLAVELSNALNEINKEITSTLNLDEILKKVVEQSAQAIGSDSSSVILIEDNQWVIKYLYGLPNELIGTNFYIDKNKPTFLAYKIGKPVIISNASNDERLSSGLVEKFNLKSAFIVPLTIKEETTGLLAFGYHAEIEKFNKSQIDFAKKLASSLSLAIENAKLFEAEAKAKDLSMALNNINMAISSSLDFGEIAEKVVGEAVKAMGCETAMISINKDGYWTVTHIAGFPMIPVGASFSEKEVQSLGLTDQSKDLIIVNDVLNDKKIDGMLAKQFGVRSYIAGPLIVREKLFGSLGFVFRSKKVVFSEEQIDFIKKLAALLSLAIENVRLYEDEREARKFGEALNKINALAGSTLDCDKVMQQIISESAQVIDAESCGVIMRKGGKWEIGHTYNLPVERKGLLLNDVDFPYVRICAETKKPVAVNDVEQDDRVILEVMKQYNVRSVMAAPLVFKGNTVGVIGWHFHTKAKAFGPYQIDFAEKMATSVSLAMQNARLFEEKAQTARLNAALIEIDSVIHSTLDPEKIMQKVITEAAKILDVDMAAVEIYEDRAWPIKFQYNLGNEMLGKQFTKRAILSELAAKEKKVVICDDTTADVRLSKGFVKKTGIRSFVVVPLKFKNKVIGNILFINKSHTKCFDGNIFDFATKLGSSFSSALENARLYQAQSEIAKTLQLSLLPEKIPKIKGLNIKIFYQSATDGAEVGGDFYDIFELPGGKFGITIGDISGKGISAAVETAKIKYMVKDKAYLNLMPNEVISQVNDGLYIQKVTTTTSNTFAALSFAVYDPQNCTLVLSNAGNPYPYFLAEDRFIEITGTPVSLYEKEKYSFAVNMLEKGDILIFFTDGLVEARHNGELFGEERVRRYVKRNKRLSLDKLIKGLIAEAQKFSHNNLTDDVLVMGIKKK